MAIIQRIRSRAGLLVALIIGMALIAFILGDFLTSGGIYFQNQRANIAEINGKGIRYEVFQSHLEEMEEMTKAQMGVTTLDEKTSQEVRQRTWAEMIQAQLMEREYSRLGISVHEDELWDLIGGNNPHPYIQQYFTDPKTGVLNRLQLQQFLSFMAQAESDNPQKKSWLYLEDLIYNDRLMTKYNNLLRKGLYATKTEVERRKADFNKSVDFSYIVKSYTEISDSAITVSQDDLKAYYKAHKEEYKQNASRDIRYVVWEVTPSEEDRKSAEKWINDVAAEIKTVDNANTWQYVKANSDLAPENRNFTKEELPEQLRDWAYMAPVGEVYGPYLEDNHYKIARLAEISNLPDSVKASHILLPINQNNFGQVKALADSLVKLIEKGADFAALAVANSTDGSAEKGGDLGWFTEGRMVQPFSDSCFYGKTGQVKQAITRFGLHIIKINEQAKTSKKVKVAVLAREIRPSETTDAYYYGLASAFGAKNTSAEKFDETVKAQNLDLRFATGLTPESMTVNNMPLSRELVRWAFNNNVGKVTEKVYQFGQLYVVAILDKSHEKGYAAFDDVKTLVEIDVKKQKKAEKLIASINEAKAGANDINSLATKLGTSVRSATGVRFTSYQIPGLGMEPKLIGASANLETNQLSQPIDGANGVYVIVVDRVEETPSQYANFEKTAIERTYMTKIYSGTGKTLEELAKVVDNRINFY